MVTYLGSLVHLCRGKGGTLQRNITGMYGECLQCLGHMAHGMCAFPVYTAQDPGELSKVGPGLHALPMHELLRFRFSGTPQRHKLSWACVLCLSQVLATQATRCLASALSPGGRCILPPSPCQLLGFLGVQQERCLRCLFWGADLWL